MVESRCTSLSTLYSLGETQGVWWSIHEIVWSNGLNWSVSCVRKNRLKRTIGRVTWFVGSWVFWRQLVNTMIFYWFFIKTSLAFLLNGIWIINVFIRIWLNIPTWIVWSTLHLSNKSIDIILDHFIIIIFNAFWRFIYPWRQIWVPKTILNFRDLWHYLLIL